MDIEKLRLYETLGTTHWWLTSKYSILKDMLKTHISAETSLDPMLDVGCGGGIFLKNLSDITNQQFGTDINFEILSKEKKNEIAATLSNAKQLPYKSETFSLVSVIDILEHVDDDDLAIRELFRVLRKGGWLLVSVPAFMALFGEHDRLFGHFRRYSKSEIARKIKSSGFHIKKITYIQPLFFLPLLIKRRFFTSKDNLLGDFNVPNEKINSFLHKLVSFERFPLRYINFPIGATVLMLAHKR